MDRTLGVAELIVDPADGIAATLSLVALQRVAPQLTG
jgi:hypothetical protein